MRPPTLTPSSRENQPRDCDDRPQALDPLDLEQRRLVREIRRQLALPALAAQRRHHHVRDVARVGEQLEAAGRGRLRAAARRASACRRAW